MSIEEQLREAAERLAIAETCAEGGLSPSKARQFVAACEMVSTALPGLLEFHRSVAATVRDETDLGEFAKRVEAALRALEEGEADAEQG